MKLVSYGWKNSQRHNSKTSVTGPKPTWWSKWGIREYWRSFHKRFTFTINDFTFVLYLYVIQWAMIIMMEITAPRPLPPFLLLGRKMDLTIPLWSILKSGSQIIDCKCNYYFWDNYFRVLFLFSSPTEANHEVNVAKTVITHSAARPKHWSLWKCMIHFETCVAGTHKGVAWSPTLSRL